jgi:hypothetical protein
MARASEMTSITLILAPSLIAHGAELLFSEAVLRADLSLELVSKVTVTSSGDATT